MDSSNLVAPDSIVGWGFGLALFAFVYSLVVWRRNKPLGRWQWQEFPPLSALAGLVFASVSLCIWWAQRTDTPARFEEVVLAGCVAVVACVPSWAYRRDNELYSVKLLPYIGSLIAASIGVSLFLRTFALYAERGWARELLDLLFASNLLATCIFVAMWLVFWLGVRFGWVKSANKPARKPRD